MNKSDKGSAVTPNYSKEQVQILIDSAPFDWDKAKELAEQFGKSPQSIVSKALSLELDYIRKPKPTKKVSKLTKAQLVEQIESKIDRKLDGLDKTTTRVLLDLINGIDHILVPDPE